MDRMERLVESFQQEVRAEFRGLREMMEAEHRSIRDDLGSFKNTMFGVVFLAWVTVMTAIVVSNFL